MPVLIRHFSALVLVFLLGLGVSNAENWFEKTGQLISRLFQSKEELKGTDGFTHRQHVKLEGFDCSECHKPVENSGRMSMPKLKECQECHDGDEVLTDQQKKGLFNWKKSRPYPEETIFSHKVHLNKEENCLSCHEGMDESRFIKKELVMKMDDCLSCHKKETQFQVQDCRVCHRQVDQNWKPGSHSATFRNHHGEEALYNLLAMTENNCSICHKTSSCNACHSKEMPKNHNQFFRHRGHGIFASMDRKQCSVCHKEDGCIQCHIKSEPVSHKGTFSSPRNRHCVTCHLPLKEEGCASCHKETPSHMKADAIPNNKQHTSAKASDCRECHIGQKLKHFDNGDSCFECHR